MSASRRQAATPSPFPQIDTSVLESQVKDVLMTAKQKISNLSAEVAALRRENQELSDMIQLVNDQKQEVERKYSEMLTNLQQQKQGNEVLQHKKVDLQNNLRNLESDIAAIVQAGQKQRQDTNIRMQEFKEIEKQKREDRQKEKMRYRKKMQELQAQIDHFKNSMQHKKQDIKQLQEEIKQMTNKESIRNAELEEETKMFKMFLDNK